MREQPVWAGVGSPPNGILLETPDQIVRAAHEISVQAVLTHSDAAEQHHADDRGRAARAGILVGRALSKSVTGPRLMHTISVAPLTTAAFSPFGELVEADAGALIAINQGFAARANDLAQVDVATGGGSINVSLFVAQPRPLPIDVKLMERHPLGSQLFFPLQDKPWLVLVCADPLVPASYRAFIATGRQGVNYARNVWHHPLLVLEAGERFLVVDRKGPGNDLEEIWLDEHGRISVDPDKATMATERPRHAE